ncbi:MAG TPA: hypothetical protein VHP33_16005 [Polyangiaceae bacterium]|nr:hypothetical protein [Polyangiaceae bacterium]
MRLFRLFVATLWLAALAFSTAPARAAGTLSFSPPIWTNRAADRLINKFNRKDCLDDATATFSLAIRGAPTNALFQVWAGTGCDNYANRSPTAVSRTCTLLTGNLAPLDQRVEIHLRDMVATPGSEVSQAVEQCDASTTAGLQTRTLYFVVSDPNTNNSLVTGTTSWAFSYDVKAPPPPTGVTAASGDETLVTKFTAPSGETNLLHYKFYCSPVGDPPATAGTGGSAGTDTGGTTSADTGGADSGASAVDAGGTATATAGTAGTTSVDTNCHSAILIPGEPPPAGAIECGEIGAQGATGGETSPVLTNDMEYVVAVATEDNVNNVGVLSQLACNIPKDTTGFYEAYREAGGEAGGGFCTFAPAHQGTTLWGLTLLAFACALWRRRQ